MSVSEQLDGVQLAVNHAIAVANFMEALAARPGWTDATPLYLYECTHRILNARFFYMDQPAWRGPLDTSDGSTLAGFMGGVS